MRGGLQHLRKGTSTTSSSVSLLMFATNAYRADEAWSKTDLLWGGGRFKVAK